MIADGCGLVLGSVSTAGEPRAVRAWAARVVDADARRVRVLIDASDEVSAANLDRGVVAVTGGNVHTFASVQLKGRVVLIEPPTAADLEAMARQVDAFFSAVTATDRTPRHMLERMLPDAVTAIEFVADQMYDQTPGPDAGAVVPR